MKQNNTSTNSQKPLVAVTLAAGKSTRMKQQAKAALVIAGQPIAQRVLASLSALSPDRVVVVVGHEAPSVKAAFGPACEFVLQSPQLGTAHALQVTEDTLRGYSGDLLVVNADHPLIDSGDLQRLVTHHRNSAADATLLTWQRTEDSSFGRILRDANGDVTGIVEVRDATPEQLALREVNLSMYCFAAPLVFDILRQIKPDNAQSEYYLTDAVGLLAQSGRRVQAISAQHPETGFGVNTPEEFARAESILLQNQPDHN